MTDNEIIKALEHCKGYLTNDCVICQNVEKYPRCNEFLNEIALNLINRQKAEIERLQKEFDTMCFVTAKRWVKNAKSEAIKEFAERFAKALSEFDMSSVGLPDYDRGYKDCMTNIEDTIDNLVKEMTEV